ncbi:MAG: hypothetical protein HYR76_06410 [Ignavibacteria bacterium]|nr:hypothetical protein [Ignavibacteria bacterium]MBI3766141.1 hypothetical protein [Ignavibacteriales bacterium]
MDITFSVRRIVYFAMVLTVCITPRICAQHFKLDADLDFTGTRFNPDQDPERTINTNFRDDDPFNPVRATLFPTFALNNTFGIEGDFLFDNKGKKFDRSKGVQPFRVDGLFLSVRGLLNHQLNFWLGKIPTPVGTFSPRSYSHTNPLIGFPLAYQYKVPYNAFTLSSESNNLFLRDNDFGGATLIYEACWITGLSAFGNVNGFQYMVAVGRGTLTNPEASENKGFQIAGRIGREFSEQLSVGLSAGTAPYLQHDAGLPSGTSIRDPKHFIAGIDASAEIDNLHLYAEAFYNSWDTPQYLSEKSIQAYSWYVEGQYFLLPNLYAASRVSQLLYSKITDPSTRQKTPWGYDVTRLESGMGFLPIPELNVKAVIQYNTIDQSATKEIIIFALQAAFRFENVQKLVGIDQEHE